MYIYKKYFPFPVRMTGGAIIAFSVIILFKNGIDIIPILAVFIGILIAFVKKGLIIDLKTKQIIKIFSFVFNLPYSKDILKSDIHSIKVDNVSYNINYKANPLSDISSQTMKKSGYYVLLILKNKEAYLLKFFYNKDDARQLASNIAKKTGIQQS